MAKRVGIGLLGLDHWYTALAVLAEASKRPGLRLVAIADRSEQRLSEVAAEHKADYVTTDFRRAIEDPQVELVCSQVNTRENVGLVRRALRAGKHVACVKPMAMTLRQADELIALAEREGRVLWSFDQLGRMRATPRLKGLIERGALGEPMSFHQVAYAGLPQPWRGQSGPSWWTDGKLAPFGAWADHAIYTIDWLRGLFGSEVKLAHGEIGNRRYPRLEVEDYGIGTLQFSDGLVAVLEHTWDAGSYYASWTKIVGTDGVLHMERAAFGEQTVLATKQGVKPVNVGGRRAGVLDAVVRLVKDGRAKPSPARESRTNLAAALAVYRAAKTGRYVRP